jgi:hypothetical protein
MTNRAAASGVVGGSYSTRHPMKALLLLALLAAPVQAQSFYPNSAGSRYCELRKLGVSHDEALSVAISESFSADRKPVYVTTNGKQYSTDVLDFARWVAKCR